MTNRKLIAAFEMIFGMALVWAIAAILFVSIPSKKEHEDSLVFWIESDLRLLKSLEESHCKGPLKQFQRRLDYHISYLKGPLREHPGCEYFLWAIKNACKNTKILDTDQLLRKLSDVPDAMPTAKRLYWDESLGIGGQQ